MKLKKFFVLFVIPLACACPACAKGVKMGILAKSVSEEAFNKNASQIWKWTIFQKAHSSDDKFKFYNDLHTMLLDFNKEELDEINLPKIIAEYLMNQNPDYEIACTACANPMGYVFSFLEKNAKLRQDFSDALALMKKDGTLSGLHDKYLSRPVINEDEVKFDSFPDSQTIRFAVTGDIPPIDYVAPNGKAAGFNTAILAEIGKRLKVNIEIIDVDTATRTETLKSGLVDGVFWYMSDGNDSPKGLVFSEPYYTFDIFLHLKN